MGVLETDYLVVGAGAIGLAFTDVLVAESDADVLLVDRRPDVGGHWNDAYPTDVRVRRKVVDATRLSGEVPATSVPSYDVAAGARWVRVGELPDVAGDASSYCVIGAGKTGMDACSWLLEAGVAPDAITWVRPRDMWLLDRASIQPLAEVGSVLEGVALDLEALALATSTEDLFARLEASGRLLRLDDEVVPTGFRCAFVDAAELRRLRWIRRVVRRGHVRRVEAGLLVLTEGEVALAPDTLVID